VWARADPGREVAAVREAMRAGKLIGLIAIADAPRPTASATVAKLRERGVQVAMLTGDNAGTAQRIARQLGINIVLADARSEGRQSQGTAGAAMGSMTPRRSRRRM
jgi:cation transport ATPase